MKFSGGRNQSQDLPWHNKKRRDSPYDWHLPLLPDDLHFKHLKRMKYRNNWRLAFKTDQHLKRHNASPLSGELEEDLWAEKVSHLSPRVETASHAMIYISFKGVHSPSSTLVHLGVKVIQSCTPRLVRSHYSSALFNSLYSVWQMHFVMDRFLLAMNAILHTSLSWYNQFYSKRKR